MTGGSSTTSTLPWSPQRLRLELATDRRRSRLQQTHRHGHRPRSRLTARPPRRRATITIDSDWLRTEYVDKRRTVPDIAAELGISPQRVRDKARQFGIPLRARGGASHNTALHPVIDPDTCPSHLLAAFQGQGAIERVRRFIVIADQPTITRAAATLGTTQSVLTSQIARLEADLGQQLIERAQPNRPCQLTPAGRDFLHHARRVLGRMDQEPTAQAG